MRTGLAYRLNTWDTGPEIGSPVKSRPTIYYMIKTSSPAAPVCIFMNCILCDKMRAASAAGNRRGVTYKWTSRAIASGSDSLSPRPNQPIVILLVHDHCGQRDLSIKCARTPKYVCCFLFRLCLSLFETRDKAGTFETVLRLIVIMGRLTSVWHD